MLNNFRDIPSDHLKIHCSHLLFKNKYFERVLKHNFSQWNKITDSKLSITWFTRCGLIGDLPAQDV